MVESHRSRNPRQKSTRDLTFAAYAHMQGLQILKADGSMTNRAREFVFVFDDPDERWEDLTLSFANSESSRFDNSVRALKKLCMRASGQRGG